MTISKKQKVILKVKQKSLRNCFFRANKFWAFGGGKEKIIHFQFKYSAKKDNIGR